MMAWVYLFAAIAFEIAGTTSMKMSEGFTRWLPSTLIFVFYAVSFTLVTFAIKHIEVSVAYTVWSAIGIAAISIIGMTRFGETVTPMKIVFIGVIIVGVVGLKLSSGDGSLDS